MTSYEIFKKIIKKLNSNNDIKTELKGWNKTFQFNIDSGMNYYIIFNEDGSANIKEGINSAPSVTMSASDPVMEDIVTGKLDGTQAFFAGKLKISGDVFLAQKLVTVLKKLE